MFLEIQHGEIGYRAPLISGINCGLDPGEICLLIGNNGVGKTTLMKSILHQIPLLKGEILLRGKNIRKLSASEIAQEIAVVFSKAPVPDHYTVKDLISLGKFIHYPYYFELSKEDDAETDTIIEELGLAPYRHLMLRQLSDGNLQKAFIGRAIAQDSPLIILDEPTTHLDESNKISVLNILRTLAKDQKRLILFSSHDWRLAKEFSDKTWYLKNHSLQAGITEDILTANPELTTPTLFNLGKNFVPPRITAPHLQKELLFSYLQKSGFTELPTLEFVFKETFWEIRHKNIQYKAQSFEDIASILKNLD